MTRPDPRDRTSVTEAEAPAPGTETAAGPVAPEQVHPDYAPPEKRSLTLRGHRSSVTLEPDFWAAFRGLAAARGLAINALAVEIDEARPPDVVLATAIRLYVLENIRSA